MTFGVCCPKSTRLVSSACSTQASLAVTVASEPDDCACTAAIPYHWYLRVLAYDNTLPWCTGRLGPDAVAIHALPDLVGAKPLGKIQPAWRDRIANLRLNKPRQPIKLGECCTGARAVAAEDTADARTDCQPAAACDSVNAAADSRSSSTD